MMTVMLYSPGREPVAQVEVPDVKPLFEVLIWGARVFKWYEDESHYVECSVFYPQGGTRP